MAGGVKKGGKRAKTQAGVATRLKAYLTRMWDYIYLHRKGTIVIVLATLLFFWPLVIRLNSYSEGGDAMFNAWEMSRNQHCILRQGCDDYTDANIYFPNKDTMLYSETQLSAGFVMLPMYFFNQNPILQYNLLTILSFFFTGWFMYLLLKYLSKGNELYSIAGALIWEFAPLKMAAIFHLQNLAILCLPIAVLCILRYFERPKRRYLVGLFLALLYVFYASWYQMAFMLLALAVILGCMWLFRLAKTRPVLIVGSVVVAATIATLPLAKEYIRFSKENKAGFNIQEQTMFSSSVADHFIPHDGTLIGKAYYGLNEVAQRNAFNLDSYSYHGMILYVTALVIFVVAFRWRKKGKEFAQNYKMIATMMVLAVVGFFVSLGPLLKLKSNFMYHIAGVDIGIPMPYILVNKFLPQLSFIRAIGRVSVLFLFALCCILVYVPWYLKKRNVSIKRQRWVTGVIMFFVVVELMPFHMIAMSQTAQAYNHYIPEVYKHVRDNDDIDNIVVLQAQEYPNIKFWIARTEVILWSGYHNKKIFNGYSGYTPKNFDRDYVDYVNFKENDIRKMKDRGLRYVIVDKELYQNKPEAIENFKKYLHDKPYEDSRYIIYKL